MILVDSFVYYGIFTAFIICFAAFVVYALLYLNAREHLEEETRKGKAREKRILELLEKYEQERKGKHIIAEANKFSKEAKKR